MSYENLFEEKKKKEKKKIVNVVDTPMGNGKTSAAIDYLNNLKGGERVIYATPYIEEGQRVFDALHNKNRVLFTGTKEHRNQPKSLVMNDYIEWSNIIICTHQVLPYLKKDTVEYIKNRNYTLIIDEALEVTRLFDKKMGKQFNMLNNLGALETASNGRVSFKDDKTRDICLDGAEEIAELVDSGCVYYRNKLSAMWFFPPHILDAFNKVIVMTYMMEAQTIYYYLKTKGYEMNYVGTKCLGDGKYKFCPADEADGFKYNARELIHIVEDPKLNSVGTRKNSLSSTWFKNGAASSSDSIKTLGKNLRSVRRSTFKCPASDFLWTAFDKQKKWMTDPYHISAKTHVPINSRATNKYSDRHYLAYLINFYVHPDIYRTFLREGCTIDQDKVALSYMLQWIWRSAIRNGEEIYIYIPSLRMRLLLEGWIEKVSPKEDIA